MFTKQDYIKYFFQIKKIEENMSLNFLHYTKKVDNPKIKALFLQMHKEEINHGKIVDSMLEMFKDKDL